MAAKKKSTNIAPVNTDQRIITQTKQSLVFISHDTRDAEIAEAFSKLLSSVSAGVLKSFRSSDRRGTQGIEYGVEWFPEIMKKLEEASDIVCLLTQTSVGRPWILYEAGVAKGKLSTTVLGIALGIPLNKANNGPFAQFQNCADDEDSLTKLVLQLVRRIPNAEPDEEVVKEQVRLFKQKLVQLLKAKPDPENHIEDLKEDTSIAKLFEEVKIMFQDLPSRIDQRLDPEIMMRKRRRFHPETLEGIFHITSKIEEPHFIFLILASMFKVDMPWLYEIGIDTYRTLKNAKTRTEREKAVDSFVRIVNLMAHPVFLDWYSRPDYSHRILNLARSIVDRYLDIALNLDK